MSVSDRPAQLLKLYEDTFFLADQMRRLRMRLKYGGWVRAQGPVLHWSQFRSWLSNGNTEFDETLFIYQGGAVEFESMKTVPRGLAEWVRLSKRAFHVDAGLQQRLIERGDGNVTTFENVTWPHQVFVLSIETPMKTDDIPQWSPSRGVRVPGVCYDSMLISTVDRPESTTKQVRVWLLPESLERRQPITVQEKALLSRNRSEHKKRELIELLWQKIQPTLFTVAFCQCAISQGSDHWFHKIVVGVCDLLARGTVRPSHDHESSDVRTGNSEPLADQDPETVCSVTSANIVEVGLISTDEPRTHSAARSGYEATPHSRREHWRRPANSPLDAKKSIKVSKCFVREDRLTSPGGLKGGTSTLKLDDN